MITTNVIPAAATSATTQTLVVEATEGMCRPYCSLGSNPSATMSFAVGSLRVIGTYVIVPIIVTTTIVASNLKCGKASTQIFNETFDVGFTATAANNIALAPAAEVKVSPAETRCCIANAVKASTILTITIS